MSAVDAALAEIDAQLAYIAPIHEGLRDYSRLNLNPDTLVEVNGAIALYDHRVALLTTAKTALEALNGDGYPDLTIPDVSLSVKADLDANQATITAAQAQFHTNAASGLGLAGGEPEPKEPPVP